MSGELRISKYTCTYKIPSKVPSRCCTEDVPDLLWTDDAEIQQFIDPKTWRRTRTEETVTTLALAHRCDYSHIKSLSVNRSCRMIAMEINTAMTRRCVMLHAYLRKLHALRTKAKNKLQLTPTLS